MTLKHGSADVLEAVAREMTRPKWHPHPPLSHAELTRGRGQITASQLRRHQDRAITF